MRSTNVPAVQALFAAPQAPLTAVAALLAEQLALPPPSVLLQDHDHGPEPDTAEAVPELHNEPPEGADARVAPLADPQDPLDEAEAEQLELPPPCSPVHVHDHGPEPDTAEAVPALHNAPPEGADALVVPLADPQPPATIGAQLGADVIEELTVVLPPVSLLDW